MVSLDEKFRAYLFQSLAKLCRRRRRRRRRPCARARAHLGPRKRLLIARVQTTAGAGGLNDVAEALTPIQTICEMGRRDDGGRSDAETRLTLKCVSSVTLWFSPNGSAFLQILRRFCITHSALALELPPRRPSTISSSLLLLNRGSSDSNIVWLAHPRSSVRPSVRRNLHPLAAPPPPPPPPPPIKAPLSF